MTTVAEAIDKLPTNPGDVAHYLHTNGYHGDMREARTCPLAKYFQAETGYNCSVLTYAVWVNGTTQCKTLPYHLKQFVDNVDNGLYPFLTGDE